MKIVDILKQRVQNFVFKQFKKKGWSFDDAPDPRKQGKITHPMGSIIWTSLLGLMSNKKTLRDVEEMTQNLNEMASKLVSLQISDTTLDNEIRRMEPDYLLGKLVQQTREAYRSKMLNPVGLTCGIVAVDGKNLATLNHNAQGTGQKRSSENSKWHKDIPGSKKNYWLMPALRAVLTSAEAKPCIYQRPLPPKSGESTVFKPLIDDLYNAYGRSGMIGIIDADAGLTSLANADYVDARGYGYVLGLKGNQPDLMAEAERILYVKMVNEKPEAETPWELRNGKFIRRRLWRTGEMQGWYTSAGCWKHLRQTWLVRQETKDKKGKIETEDRFFISSILWNYLKPYQILTLIRNHWAVENDCFNSLDLQWKEDSAPWCTQGAAIWSLGILRIMSYNMVQYLRRRRLRPKDKHGRCNDPLAWRSLFAKMVKAFEYPCESEMCTKAV